MACSSFVRFLFKLSVFLWPAAVSLGFFLNRAYFVVVVVLQHFPDLSSVFDQMRVSLESNTTLVPPDFESWVASFTLYTDFNYTQYNTMVNKLLHSHTRTQSLDFCSRWRDLRAEEADFLLRAVLLAAIARRSGKVISVQSLTLSDQLGQANLLENICSPPTCCISS